MLYTENRAAPPVQHNECLSGPARAAGAELTLKTIGEICPRVCPN